MYHGACKVEFQPFWEGNFEKSSLAEFACDARSFAGDREGCCVGGTWRGHAVSGDRVALRTRSCYIITDMFSKIHLDIITINTTTTTEEHYTIKILYCTGYEYF